MSLFQLVYTSTRNSNCDDNEINKILASCKKNNPSKEITGVLLHSENRFIQYLEGDKDIIKLFDMIKDDKRHSKVVLLSYGLLKERIFPTWHMGYKNLTKEKIDFLTEGNPEEKKLFEAIISGKEQKGNSAVNLITKFFNK